MSVRYDQKAHTNPIQKIRTGTMFS